MAEWTHTAKMLTEQHPRLDGGVHRGVPSTEEGLHAIPHGLGTPNRDRSGWSDPRTRSAFDPTLMSQPTMNENELIDASIKRRVRYSM